MAGETKDPQKSIPFALLIALLVVAFIYILVQIVSIGTLPGLASSERPLADAANAFLGPFGAAFITVGALISILGNLNVGMLGGTRLLFAMAERNEFPAVVGKVHEKFRTPHVSIILTGVVILILTIFSSFITALAIATITRLLVYATTCLALPVLRGRDNAPEAKFKAPLGVVAAGLSILLIIWLLTQVSFAREGIPILIAAAIGIVIFFANKMFGKSTTGSSS
jgi:amino acid transporter